MRARWVRSSLRAGAQGRRLRSTAAGPSPVHQPQRHGLADPVPGIQMEALHSVGGVGGRDATAADAVTQSGVLDSMILSQTHKQPHLRVRPPPAP